MIRNDRTADERRRWDDLASLLGLPASEDPGATAETVPSSETLKPEEEPRETPFPLDEGKPVLLAASEPTPAPDDVLNELSDVAEMATDDSLAPVETSDDVIASPPESATPEENGVRDGEGEGEESAEEGRGGRRRRGRRRGRRGRKKESTTGTDDTGATGQTGASLESGSDLGAESASSLTEESAGLGADPLQETEDSASAGSAEENEGEEKGDGKRRRRRRRRGRKKEGGSDDSPTERTDDGEIEDTSEETPQPISVLDEEADEELSKISNWNIPSWEELIGSLYRPER